MYRILYVDDEPSLLEIGKLFLERSGQFSVDIITSAPAALTLLSSKTYDAIISDYQMPEMDGIEFLKNVRTSGNTLPFVLFTGKGREEVVIQALNEGADFYLQKGGDPKAQFAELLNKVHYAVIRRRTEQALKMEEAQLKQIIDLVPHMIFAKDWNGNYLLANRAVAEGYNTTVDEIVGKSQAQFHGDPAELRHMFEDDREVMTTGRTKFIPEESYIDAFGKRRTLQTTKVPFTMLGSNRQAVLGVAIDITDRKKAEELTRTTLQQLSTLVSRLNSGVIMVSEDGKVEQVNQALCDLYNLPDSPERLSGMTSHEMIEKILDAYVFPAEALARIRELITRWKPVNGYEIALRNGRIVMVDFIPIIDADGQKRGRIWHHQDITERKRVEEALRERNSQINALIDNLPFDVWAMDSSGRYVLQNPVSVGHWGDSIGKNPHQIPLPADLLERWQENNRKAFEGNIVRDEISVPFKGRVRTYEEIIAPVRLGDEIREIIGVNIDITERKQAEKALRASEEKYRGIFAAESDGIAIVDRETGILIDCNDAFLLMHGYRKDELIGQPVTATSADPDATRAAIMAGTIHIQDRYHKRKDGSAFPVEITVNGMLLQGRDILIGAIRDITGKKLAEEALRQANRKLNLLSSITRHDINNQMTVLQSYLALLENEQPDPAYTKNLRQAETAAQRISAMIRFTKEYESIGVNAPLWQDCPALVETAARQTPLEDVLLKNDIPAKAEVFADPMIVRVFYNLMENAARHGGKITTIRFSAQESGHDYQIVCEDDGDGIPVDLKEKIFDREFGKNTGLGLFLSREILSITGITIHETGEPGKGARFEIIVPHGSFRV
ncbi:MAG: PAS domain S-box protein [Methanoregula sp.]|jgi:PAS domain S-box-containing protein|uniref:hybrid sensor histidine kinase/response regulator n=1 Tax=Methanoregula sp. TaxID=2052170 RepID=UPI003D121DDC